MCISVSIVLVSLQFLFIYHQRHCSFHFQLEDAFLVFWCHVVF